MIGIDAGLGDLFKGLIGLGGEFIEDKDKRNEFNMKIMESQNAFNTAILTQETHPKVDAAVKLLFALNSLWRPIGSFLMAGFGIYSYMTGITLPSEIQVLLFGAPIGWGVSRHIEKGKK